MAEYKFGQVSAALFGYSEHQVYQLKKENELYNKKTAKKRKLSTDASDTQLSGSYNKKKINISNNNDVVGKIKNAKRGKGVDTSISCEKMTKMRQKNKKAGTDIDRMNNASSPTIEKAGMDLKAENNIGASTKDSKHLMKKVKKNGQMVSALISASSITNGEGGKKQKKTNDKRLLGVKSKSHNVASENIKKGKKIQQIENKNVDSQNIKKLNKKQQIEKKVASVINVSSSTVKTKSKTKDASNGQSTPGQYCELKNPNDHSNIEENVESLLQIKKRKENSEAENKPLKCDKKAVQNGKKTGPCASNSLVPVSSRENSEKIVLNKDKETTLFIGNIPTSMTKKKLMKLFKEYGTIQSVRFRSATPAKPGMPKKGAVITKKLHPDRKSIHAYIDFSQKESATMALEKNGFVVDGNHLRVDYTHQKPNKNLKNKMSVFVGNLPFAVEDETVYGHFERCGSIEGVRVIREQNTGLGKGFAYVTFKERDTVNLALELNGSEIDGRKIRVSKATDYRKPRQFTQTPTKGKFKSKVNPTKKKFNESPGKNMKKKIVKKKFNESPGKNKKKKIKKFKPKTNQNQARRRLKKSAAINDRKRN